MEEKIRFHLEELEELKYFLSDYEYNLRKYVLESELEKYKRRKEEQREEKEKLKKWDFNSEGIRTLILYYLF